MKRSMLVVMLLVMGACASSRPADTALPITYLQELATEADGIVQLATTDAQAAKLKAMMLQERMCSYVAGLETAGVTQVRIQAHIDAVGPRLGAAFSLLGE